MESEGIILISVVDKHLAVMQAALLQSVQHNHKSGEKIIYYIVADNLTSSIRKRIEFGIDNDIIDIIWLKIEDVLYKRTRLTSDKSFYPINVYARLFAPYFLPQKCEKAIYLDVDMICREDISKLWSINIGEYPVAGVIDGAKTFDGKWAGIPNYHELGFSAKTEYFNSGMFVMNIQRWNALDATYNIIKIIDQNRKFASFPINYGMNVFFAGQWHKLDKRWNSLAPFDEEDPFIIHFVGSKPIFKSYRFKES